ncbi:MAG TPA: LysR family transcriptional regulator, partial [Xanthobacteraceae bacterium]|nr:LysR family transcriptional regulator [Xanthobacteraceae bacterium]
AHVQSLEERLGVRLLNRSTRRVSLTEVGHAYYERCSQVLADVRRVAIYRFVVAGAPSYLAARGTPKQPADLAHHNCLVYSHSGWGNEWRFAAANGEQSVTVRGNLHANSDNALRLAAVHGQGLALAPSFLLIDEIKAGRLIPVLTEFLQTEHAINAIYPHRHHLSAKVRSFIDLLAKHFHTDPAWADPRASRLIATTPAAGLRKDGPPAVALRIAAE